MVVVERQYAGITLEKALEFSNDDWCEQFFKSFAEVHRQNPGKMIYLQWEIYR